MKSKKSQEFMILVVIVAIGVLTAALLIINLQRPYDKTIGWRQAMVVKTYQEAEKAFFYTDQSAKYSAYQTIYDLGQKGGYETSDCGNYLGYSLWVNFDDEKNLIECYPKTEEIEENFKPVFKKNLGGYLIKYPNAELPEDNYDVSLKNENNKLEIIGKAMDKLTFKITKEEKNN